MKKIRKYYMMDATAIVFGYYPGDGDGGVMTLRWRQSPQRGLHDPKLELHDGSWRHLPLMDDVFRALAVFDSAAISPPEFCQLLEECGFVEGDLEKEDEEEEDLFDIKRLKPPEYSGFSEYRAIYELLEDQEELTTAEAVDICEELIENAKAVIKILTEPAPKQ